MKMNESHSHWLCAWNTSHWATYPQTADRFETLRIFKTHPPPGDLRERQADQQANPLPSQVQVRHPRVPLEGDASGKWHTEKQILLSEATVVFQKVTSAFSLVRPKTRRVKNPCSKLDTLVSVVASCVTCDWYVVTLQPRNLPWARTPPLVWSGGGSSTPTTTTGT